MRLPELTSVINGEVRTFVPSIHDLTAGTELAFEAYDAAFKMTTGAFVILPAHVEGNRAKLQVCAQFAGQYVASFMWIDLPNEDGKPGELFKGRETEMMLTVGYLITTVADLVMYRAISVIDVYRKSVQVKLGALGWTITPTGEAKHPSDAPPPSTLKN